MKKLIFVSVLLLAAYYGNAQLGEFNYVIQNTWYPVESKLFDLDNDGDLDVLVASQSDDKVAWYENLGGGEFSIAKVINYSAPEALHFGQNGDVEGAWSVDAKDLDNDGDLDVLFTGIYDNKVGWYENLGGGNFGAQNVLSTSLNGPKSIYADDIDGDGDIDILAGGNYKVEWYENQGAGVFSTGNLMPGSTNNQDHESVYISDLDGDGDKEVLYTSGNIIEGFNYNENLGGGSFGPRQILFSPSGRALSVYAEDLDNDGDKEIIGSNSSNAKVVWFENLGNLTFSTYNSLSDSVYNPESVYAADIDSDGLMDVISVYSDNGAIAWYQNLGSGNFSVEKIIPSDLTSPAFVRTGDIDGDGHTDILACELGNAYINWYKNDGNANFPEQKYVSTGKTHYSYEAADFDNDGYIDVAYSANNQIVWHQNMGNGIQFDKGQIIIDSITQDCSIEAADLDNDGDNDLLYTLPNDNKVGWCENIGNGIFNTPVLIDTILPVPVGIYTSDLDNDGDLDVVFYSATNSALVWHENINGTIDTIQKIIGVNADFANTQPFDIDNDGDMDVLAALGFDNKVVWYENLGSSFDTLQHIISSNVALSYSVSSADFDLDGDLDVVYTSRNNHKTIWHENLGGIIDTTQLIISTTSLYVDYVTTVDLDSDGDQDIISRYGNSSVGKWVWYENLGSQMFSPEKTFKITSLTMDNPILIQDVDGDADLDFIIGLNYGTVSWVENYYTNPRLKGQIFYDANQNKLLDSNERGFQAINTQLQPTALYNYSDSLGNYFFAVDSGVFTVSYQPDSLWNLTTDSVTYTRTLTNLYQVEDSLNFGFYPDTVLTIIQPDITGSFPRCNDTVNYWVSIQNQGTSIPNGIIHVQLDDSITYYSAAITPDSINGQNIYWHYDSLFFFDSEKINLQVIMPPFTSIGDTLTSYVIVHELDIGNNIIYSNIDSLEQVSLCAYDPNDKSVSPKGLGLEGFISQNQELEYLIRFQNTGNDTAITVMIRDELDENLDWSTLQPISSSDPVQIWIEQDGEAVFKFENIMLPDSGADFLGSQGFVKFSIQPDTGLAPLTPIYNTGHIYFDFNPAVITNTVLNTIECYSAPLPNVTYSFPYLDAGVNGNYTYQWFLNDTIIVGATNDTLMPFVDGDYTVEVTDSNGCFKISMPYTYIGISTGLNSSQQLKTVVFPNPFNESTTILFNNSLNSEYDLLVYNIVGAEAKRINKIVGNRVTINKKDIGKGMFLVYLINNQTGERIFMEKLIVQ